MLKKLFHQFSSCSSLFCPKTAFWTRFSASSCCLLFKLPLTSTGAKKSTFFKTLEIQIFMPIFEFSSKNYKFWCAYRLGLDKVHQFMIFSSIIQKVGNQHSIQFGRKTGIWAKNSKLFNLSDINLMISFFLVLIKEGLHV